MLSPSCKSYAACPTFHFSHVPGSCMEPRCVDGSGKLPADAKSCRSQQSQLLSSQQLSLPHTLLGLLPAPEAGLHP